MSLTPMQTSLLMDFQTAIGRAEHYAMRVNLGLYRGRIVHKGGSDGPLMSNAELLQDEMNTHMAHLRRADELSEAFKGTLTDEDRKVLHRA